MRCHKACGAPKRLTWAPKRHMRCTIRHVWVPERHMERHKACGVPKRLMWAPNRHMGHHEASRVNNEHFRVISNGNYRMLLMINMPAKNKLQLNGHLLGGYGNFQAQKLQLAGLPATQLVGAMLAGTTLGIAPMAGTRLGYCTKWLAQGLDVAPNGWCGA
jgi:hypothetical protein